MNKLFYFATPYSAKTREEEHQNFVKAAQMGAQLIRRGYWIYSPITHTHPIHIYGKFPHNTWQLWMDLDKFFIERCDGIILGPHWQTSKGCRLEKEAFEMANKPIYYYEEIMKGE